MTLEQDEDSQYRLITKPAFEKDPWDSDYYDFIDTVDAELVPQGTTTQRDNTSPYTDSLWYNTTEDRLERYDGTSWVVARAEALEHGNEVHSEDFATSSEISSIQSSSDVDHDDTQGGTTGNPHADSASVNDVSDIQQSSDVVHDDTDGGTTGNPHADSASVNDVSDIQQSSDVVHDDTDGGTGGTPHDHADPDDPVTQFGVGTVNDGEAVVNEGGTLTGGSAGGEIDLIEVVDIDGLPDAENLTSPTIAYIQSEDDYMGAFQE